MACCSKVYTHNEPLGLIIVWNCFVKEADIVARNWNYWELQI